MEKHRILEQQRCPQANACLQWGRILIFTMAPGFWSPFWQKKQWNTPDLETDDFASLCLDISWFPGGWARHRDHTALEATETGPWLCVVHSLQSCQAHLCLIWPVYNRRISISSLAVQPPIPSYPGFSEFFNLQSMFTLDMARIYNIIYNSLQNYRIV